MKFEDLRLAPPLLQAVAALGYTEPTPIQVKAIPHALEGRDVLGCAQTGTGKTAAFALPILHRLMEKPAAEGSGKRKIRVLVLSPTRELAAQIDESFRDYGKYAGQKYAVIFGGVNQNPQTDALRSGVDIVVATPGRLLDLMEQRFVDLSAVEILVLDEADRMLDMGFINDIRRIVAKTPRQRQTLFFSATMPGEIRRLADTILTKPVTVEATPPATAAANVTQAVYYVGTRDKPVLLAHLLTHTPYSRVLVFVRTKHGTDRVVKQLRRWGIKADAIHGDKTQGARTRALENFKSLKTQILIATDIAARGLDVDDISHVINYDIPHEPETYVHRIGRTGRAGASGEAISFCAAEEHGSLWDIERLTKKKVAVLKADSPEYLERLRHPDLGAKPLPYDDEGDARPRHEPHRSRGARGQRARDHHQGGPRQDRHDRGDRGGQRPPRPEGANAAPHPREHAKERDEAYESASADFFKPQRPPAQKGQKGPNRQPQAHQPQAHQPPRPNHPAHPSAGHDPRAAGRPRRSQG